MSTTTDQKQQTLPRPPVVTIMGHVDHGKTTLLDAIRNTHVAEKEHGGITQHIGAYQITYKGQVMTFIDTPGHAAFSEMRARGARVTDVVILVIAADDGVMPQTKESIAHIQASGVPFLIAANKMDAPGADVNKIKQQLAEQNVLVEGYGGDIVLVPISAKTKQGLDELLDMVLLVCEMSELKDLSKDPFKGVVIESSLDRFKGPVATLLVQAGTIGIGDHIMAGIVKGKIRSLRDSAGNVLKSAHISMPVEVLGFESVPGVGEVVSGATQVPSPTTTQEKKEREVVFSGGPLDKKEFRLIIKADVAGSLEALVRAVQGLETDESKIKILLQETGDITESDVYLAQSTKALILGFNIKTLPTAVRLAEQEKVLIRIYTIIYELLDDLKEGIDALVVKEEVEQERGKAKVLALFNTSSGLVVGSKVTEGEFSKGDTITLFRDNLELARARVVSMRHLKEEITKAKVNQEFGLISKPELDFTVGDIIISYYK